MSALERWRGLSVELVGGRLVIAIGIDALINDVRGSDDWDEERWRISDADAFAAAIVRGLEREEEDGTTLVHLAIDGAVAWAIEQGEDGVEDLGDRDAIEPSPEWEE